MFFFPRRAHRLAEEDRLAALRRNQEEYDLFLSADPASRRRGTVTSRSPDCVSLADRTCRPYGPGSEGRRRADHLARRTRERQAADTAQALPKRPKRPRKRPIEVAVVKTRSSPLSFAFPSSLARSQLPRWSRSWRC